jgi:hypothetical protein
MLKGFVVLNFAQIVVMSIEAGREREWQELIAGL